MTQKRAPIGLFYGSSTCYTEMVAEKIQAILGNDTVDLINIGTQPIAQCQHYDYLLFGIPTWDYGELQEDWDDCWDELAALDLNGKHAACFGLGDQRGYPQWYQDALGYLYHHLKGLGVTLHGPSPARGHSFEASQALSSDRQSFVGLALDEENQAELTEQRLRQWLSQVLREFGLE